MLGLFAALVGFAVMGLRFGWVQDSVRLWIGWVGFNILVGLEIWLGIRFSYIGYCTEF